MKLPWNRHKISSERARPGEPGRAAAERDRAREQLKEASAGRAESQTLANKIKQLRAEDRISETLTNLLRGTG